MALSATALLVLAAISLGIGGLAPGALYASAPHTSPAPANLPTMIGLLQQASNLGQFAGPMMLGALAAHYGWPAVAFAAVPVAPAGAMACLLLRGADNQ
jgi:MFS family permease